MRRAIFSLESRLGHDGVDVYPDKIIIRQRMKGDLFVPIAQLTEVRIAGQSFAWWHAHRVHLRVGSKKYVIRHLRREEAEDIVDAIEGA